jgi:O-antigen/teichoic acid export membrane protein
MTLAGGLVGVLARWYFIAWRPRLMFSAQALKPLFKYGWKLTVSALLDTGFNNLYGLIIGKYYSRADLSFVNKGRHLPELLMNNVNGTLGQVAFPALAKIQDDRIKVRETMRRMMVVSTFFVFPLMMLLAAFYGVLVGGIIDMFAAFFGGSGWTFTIIGAVGMPIITLLYSFSNRDYSSPSGRKSESRDRDRYGCPKTFKETCGISYRL